MNMNYFIGKKFGNFRNQEFSKCLEKINKLNYEHGAVYCWKLRNFEIQKNKFE